MSLDLSSSFHQFRISMAGGGKNRIFAFDHFKLDSGRLMLYRDGSEVSIPPKVAKTLSVLVESAGTIITKDEVIERVWDDSIVEESNLTQYLYLLRKVLGNMPDGRPYIETLRRRGYRFNGEVVRVSDETPSINVATARLQADLAPQFGGVEREGNVLRVVGWQPHDVPIAEPDLVAGPAATTATAPDRRSAFPRIAIAGLLLLLAGGAGLIFLWPRLMPAATNAESQKELSVITLTNGPTPHGATISPDGNAFVYHEIDGDISRLYVQQTGQPSRIEIESSTDKIYAGKTFSPDGQSVYYTGVDKKTRRASIYRIPTMGGSAVKVVDDPYGSVTFSPDGKEIAFCRLNRTTNESSLVIATRDGRAERVVLQRKSPRVVGASPAWSPDGKTIAFGEVDDAGGRAPGIIGLKVVDVATGRVNEFSRERWDNILRTLWSPDGSGVYLIATRENDGYSTRRDQVYFISYPEGVSLRVTTEGHRHEPDSLGITKKGDILAVPANRSSQIWALDPGGDTNTAVQLTKGLADGRAGLGPLPDGSYGYLARTADEISIMLSNADASNTKQLGTGFEFVEELRSDPLGRFFVFSTMKEGRSHIFRINIDGGAVNQLTFGDGREIDSTISPDGKYVVYDSGFFENGVETYALMRIPSEGGEPVTLKPKGCFIPTYSPDGSLLSCIDYEKAGIVIVSAADGSELERHPLPSFATWNFGIGWTPDGSGLIYIVNEKGTSNLWIQPRDGSKPRPLTNFTSGIIFRYAFAPDGSKLYVARGYPRQDAILIKNFR